MSDVTVAPSAAPPPPNEVPIQPAAPVSNPVGSQAPDKPPEQQRAESRRESIQKAFERSRQENPPKAREAKIGDNNPPEETKVERKAPPPLNLKRRPTEQQAEPPARAEHGHFAPRQQQAAQQQPGTQQQPRPGAPRHDQPLQRMSNAAKTEWMKVPETVRHDVHRLHDEFGRAYQKMRGDHEVMNSIRPFHEMATQHGTTLANALSAYTGMEHKLRNDVVGGLDLIINNLNLRADDGTPEGRKLSLMDVAWHIVNQTPEQRQLLQSRNTAMAQSHQLQQANARIQALETHARQAQYVAHFHQTRGGVDHYANSHPRFDELGELILNEVKLGFDLDTAYRRAELLRPATTAAQTRTNGTAPQTRNITTAQTRPTDRSISGAPSGPSNGTGRSKAPVSRRDAIANAMRRANGSL